MPEDPQSRRAPLTRTVLILASVTALTAAAAACTSGRPSAPLTVVRPAVTLDLPPGAEVTFGPDGKTLAAGDAKGRVQLWSLPSRTLIATLTNPAGRLVSSIAFSPDGKTLATGDVAGGTQLWNIASRTLIATLTDPAGALVSSIAFSPDGKTVATVEEDDDIYLWDVASRTRIATFASPPRRSVYSVAFSPDGKTLATGYEDGDVYLWNVAGRIRIATLTRDRASLDANTLVFSPDGKTLAIGNENGSTYLWNVASRTQIATFDLPARSDSVVCAVEFSPDGRILATSNWPTGPYSSGSVTFLWNIASRSRIAVLTHPSGPSVTTCSIAFSPDGKTIIGTDDGSASAYLWNIASLTRPGSPAARSSMI